MRLPTGRVNARSGQVCMVFFTNVHAPFLSKVHRRESGAHTRRVLRRVLG